MPVRKVKGGYKWGSTGKVYKTRAAAERQGRAIHSASGYYNKGGMVSCGASNPATQKGTPKK